MIIPKKWLFCGDSIIDGNHSRCGDLNHIMGHGFAFIAAAYLGSEYPRENLQYFNTARSGINSVRLLHSWEQRVLSINCDVLTLLAGINDTNTLFDEDKNSWQKYNASSRAYEQNLRYMLSLAKKKNPRLEIILGVPFYYHIDAHPEYSDTRIGMAEKSFTNKIRRYAQYEHARKLADLKEKQNAVRKMADAFGAHLLDFPAVIDRALESAPLEHWIWDGVHPTVPCHMLMFKEWLTVCQKNGLLP